MALTMRNTTVASRAAVRSSTVSRRAVVQVRAADWISDAFTRIFTPNKEVPTVSLDYTGRGFPKSGRKPFSDGYIAKSKPAGKAAAKAAPVKAPTKAAAKAAVVEEEQEEKEWFSDAFTRIFTPNKEVPTVSVDYSGRGMPKNNRKPFSDGYVAKSKPASKAAAKAAPVEEEEEVSGGGPFDYLAGALKRVMGNNFTSSDDEKSLGVTSLKGTLRRPRGPKGPFKNY